MPDKNYTEIMADTNSSEGERTPLNSTNGFSKRLFKSSWSNRKWWFGGAVLLAAALAAILHHRSTLRRQQVIHVETPMDEAQATMLYRPNCVYYPTTTTTAPKIIQTSMKEPSQQYASKPCYADGRTVTLNEFGAPDAILRISFQKPAFNHSILGFGGAFTEASALNYGRLTQTAKDAVMELLYGKSGLGYTLGRVHINSCDFSIQSYSFDETEDDFELKNFDMNVVHDAQSGMIDMALRATSVLRKSWTKAGDGILRMYASPWSPPSWMKKPTWEDRPGDVHAAKMTYSAEPNCLREGVGPESRYAKAWALYFSKFLTAYRNLGLPMWAITVQNEPEFPAPWEACAYSPAAQHDFVANHLGPQLRQDHPETKIFIFDHNKDHVNTWAEALLNSSSKATPFVDGVAYHWYAGGMDRLLDGAIGNANMHRLQAKLEKFGMKESQIVLGSEACHCPTTGYSGGDIEVYWARAERYAKAILADLAAGSYGWVEWNLILDGIGGPNHLGNLCEATLLAVPHRAVDAGEDVPPLPSFEKNRPMGNVSIGDGRTLAELNALGFPAKYLQLGVAVQPLYFYMGHISRYVRPGSQAVMGLVDQAIGPSRIFRPKGSVVAGGGINDLARVGIELTVWPCEGSTRQQFQYNEQKRFIEVYGHDWLGHPTKSCIAHTIDKDLMGLQLTECYGEAGVFDFIPAPGDNMYYIKMRNHPVKRGECLVILDLENNGGAYGPRGGAQVTLGDCSEASAVWKVDKATGEASSFYFGDEENQNEVCLTTGWPFLQMGAFLTPNGESPKTVVILNEARDSANYALQTDDGILLTGMIPQRSIQTLSLS